MAFATADADSAETPTCVSSLKYVTVRSAVSSLVIASGVTAPGRAHCPQPGSGGASADAACIHRRSTFVDIGIVSAGVPAAITLYAAGTDGAPLAAAYISVSVTRVPDTISYYGGPVATPAVYNATSGVFAFGAYLQVRVPVDGTAADGTANVTVTVAPGPWTRGRFRARQTRAATTGLSVSVSSVMPVSSCRAGLTVVKCTVVIFALVFFWFVLEAAFIHETGVCCLTPVATCRLRG